MKSSEWQKQAMAFIATYDKPDGDAYDRHMTRMSRRWLSLVRSPRVTQGLVNALQEELSAPVPDNYGCGWQELGKKFIEWAVEEEWLGEESA